jgi:hypothetical protein
MKVEATMSGENEGSAGSNRVKPRDTEPTLLLPKVVVVKKKPKAAKAKTATKAKPAKKR